MQRGRAYGSRRLLPGTQHRAIHQISTDLQAAGHNIPSGSCRQAGLPSGATEKPGRFSTYLGVPALIPLGRPAQTKSARFPPQRIGSGRKIPPAYKAASHHICNRGPPRPQPNIGGATTPMLQPATPQDMPSAREAIRTTALPFALACASAPATCSGIGHRLGLWERGSPSTRLERTTKPFPSDLCYFGEGSTGAIAEHAGRGLGRLRPGHHPCCETAARPCFQPDDPVSN